VPGGWSRRRARRRGGSGCAAAESSPSSVLLDSGVEEFPPLSPDELEPVLAEIAALGSLLIVHAEDAEAIDRAPAAAGYRYADFLASRPRARRTWPSLQHCLAVRPYRGRALLGQVREAWLRGNRWISTLPAASCFSGSSAAGQGTGKPNR
jgi:hypothetical protein